MSPKKVLGSIIVTIVPLVPSTVLLLFMHMVGGFVMTDLIIIPFMYGAFMLFSWGRRLRGDFEPTSPALTAD